jgi:hypothetical protein
VTCDDHQTLGLITLCPVWHSDKFQDLGIQAGGPGGQTGESVDGGWTMLLKEEAVTRAEDCAKWWTKASYNLLKPEPHVGH